MKKSLDAKLDSIHADPHGSREFILCDAKDSDMAFGALSGGPYASHEQPDAGFSYRTKEEFLDQIRAIVEHELVDIMLMSGSVSERLALDERIFDASAVTPAVRANDTSDVHAVRGGVYPRVASRPFRSATIEQFQCGKVQCNDTERTQGVDLGLYSVTFNNDVDRDLAVLEAYKTFRLEAEALGFRHFLEVFSPNVPGVVDSEILGHFINDHVIRALAAVPKRSRPIFLKTVFHGPRFLEELVRYDPHLVVGVMGGAAGTTFDAFDLLYQTRRYGGRAALFGRKINQAEHQPAFIRFLRLIADGEVLPGEAVRAYHGVLDSLGIRPRRPLKDDLQATVDLMAGEERSSASVLVPEELESAESAPASPSPAAAPAFLAAAEAEPDWDTMTLEQKLDYNQRRRDRIFG